MSINTWHRFYDPGVPPVLEFEDITLPGFLERSAAEYPDATALNLPQSDDDVPGAPSGRGSVRRGAREAGELGRASAWLCSCRTSRRP